MTVIKRAKTFMIKCYVNDTESQISEKINKTELEVNGFLNRKSNDIIEASIEVKVISQDGQALSEKGLHARIFIFYIISYTTGSGTL